MALAIEVAGKLGAGIADRIEPRAAVPIHRAAGVHIIGQREGDAEVVQEGGHALHTVDVA